MATLRSDRRLYLNADRSRVCEEGDRDAAFLLAGPSGIIGTEDVARLKLSMQDGRVVHPWMKDEASGAEVQEDDAPQPPEEEVGESAFQWTLKTPPEDYLEQYPDGKQVGLARRILGLDD